MNGIMTSNVRRGMAGALMALILCGSNSGAVQRTREDGDRLQQKLDEINRNAAAAEPQPKITPFTESEINSYLAFNIKDKIPKGLANPEITIVGNGSLAGRVFIDFDEFNRNRKPREWMDPLAYLSGRIPVDARGVLRTQNGRGQFHFGAANIHGIPLPKSFVQELVSYFSRTAQNPRGFNLDAPFDLPAKIRRIDVAKGEAVMVQ
jgi:hypothetical protein